MRTLLLPLSRNLFLLLLLLTTGNFLSAQTYNFDAVLDGSTGTLSNGWVGSSTTAYRWEANSGTTGSGGTGPTTDHTLQTTAGIYIYIEASSPAALGDSTLLTSPNLILTPFTNPGFEFYYHKFGTSMGDLYIDVFDGTNWNRSVDSIIGAVQTIETDAYLAKQVNLSGYPDTVQVRFRAVCGTSWSGDMAIDGVSIIELPQFDLVLSDPGVNPAGYSIWPESQAPSLTFNGTLGNQGTDSLTNATFKVTVGTFSDSVSVAALASGQSATVTTTNPFTPAGVGSYAVMYSSYANENDTIQTNNTDMGTIAISDSVYARDDSIATGSLGIGVGTTGILGQIFDITAQDTLTSVSFFLNGAIAGDTTFVELYSFNGTPQTVLATTDTLFIPAGGGAWYTLSFPCPQILTPGTYFLGVNELNNNITLGTNTNFFAANTGWVIFGTNAWQPSEFYGFPVNYLLRMNLGNASIPDLIQDASICAGDSVVYSLPAGYSNIVWNGSVNTSTFAATGAGPLTVSADNASGCTFTDTVNVNVLPLPNAGIGTTFELCSTLPAGTDLFLALGGSPDTGGVWTDDDNSGGLSGSVFTPGVPGAGTYQFSYIVTDSCGLMDTSSLSISVVLPPVAGSDGQSLICDIDPAVDLMPLLNGSPMMGGTWVDLDNTGGLTGSTFDPSGVAAGTYNFAYIISNTCGSDTSNVMMEVQACVSIDPASLITFQVYPNPSQGDIQLKISELTLESMEIRVLDLNGRELFVQSSDPTNLVQLDLGNLASGVYLIEVKQGEKFGRRRLMIE